VNPEHLKRLKGYSMSDPINTSEKNATASPIANHGATAKSKRKRIITIKSNIATSNYLI